jgi:hypothetical protein
MPARNAPLAAAALLCVMQSSGAASAQGGPPERSWGGQGQIGAAWMSSAGLASGGDVSSNRWFVQPGASYLGADWGSVGFAVGYGEASYDFSGGAGLGGGEPWNRIRELQVSVPIRIEASARTEIFVIPSLRYDAESGASLSDGQTWGVLAGVSWDISDRLRLGPGIGWFSKLEESDSVIPIVLIDWEISERWSLTTGELFGATRGPGLSLNWQASEDWQIGLTARYESIQFRLDDNGPAPGGVGEDEFVPIVLGARWEPNPLFRASVFAGVQTGGKLRLYDKAGTRIAESDYDTAPLFGMTARLRF